MIPKMKMGRKKCPRRFPKPNLISLVPTHVDDDAAVDVGVDVRAPTDDDTFDAFHKTGLRTEKERHRCLEIIESG